MDPATLIGAGASLLGGIFGKSKKTDPMIDTARALRGSALGAREASEEFGFNPLTLLGVSSPLQGQVMSNPMGQAIADAGMILADRLAKRQDAQKLQQAQERIVKLQERLDHQTLRPVVGGVYARREMSPKLPSFNGGGNGRAGISSHRDGSGVPDVLSGDGPSGVGVPVPDPRLDQGTGWFGAGRYIEPTPGWSPSSVIEEEYAEIGSNLYAPVKAARDAAYNFDLWLRDRSNQAWKDGLIDQYQRNGGQWVDGSLLGKRPRPKPKKKPIARLDRPSDFY
ncbi:hypothetical protein [Pseudogemmobacter humi]|uniref:DNA pilot protein n=1 Tax=Pseudogemmobacter humi TaxID=2483812 RepID=A0A3P5XS59_9RHOB|nr:hypothetical protein [Pseudogemmobacter humi]VDC31842.1 hypothetical protein XINFAN_03188 [Pseudogemmobacter humi]